MTMSEEQGAVTGVSKVAVFVPIEQAIASAVTGWQQRVYDLSTSDGLAVAKADLADVKDYLKQLEKARKAAKDDSLKYGRFIDAEAKRISEPVVTAIQAPLAKMIADEEGRAARIDAERRAAIVAKIDAMRAMPKWGATSGEIKIMLDAVAAVTVDAMFAEFEDEAVIVQVTARRDLLVMMEQAATAEAQVAEAAAIKAAAPAVPAFVPVAVASFASPLRTAPATGGVMAHNASAGAALRQIIDLADNHPWTFELGSADDEQLQLIVAAAWSGLSR
jgi:hypothetical protein